MIQNEYYALQLSNEYFRLRELDYVQKQQLYTLHNSSLETDTYINITKACNRRLLEIAKICEKLGLVPHGTPPFNLPNGYGQRLGQ